MLHATFRPVVSKTVDEVGAKQEQTIRTNPAARSTERLKPALGMWRR
jgi:hypothetical protein